MQVVHSCILSAIEASLIHLFLDMTEQDVVDGFFVRHRFENFVKEVLVDVLQFFVVIEDVKVGINDQIFVSGIVSFFDDYAVEVGGTLEEVAAFSGGEILLEQLIVFSVEDHIQDALQKSSLWVNEKLSVIRYQLKA